MHARLTGIAAGLALAATLSSTPAAACGVEPYLGEICTFGFTFCPRGYLAADGSILSIASNSALFSLLGTTYGGNGTTTFALPDLRGRAAIGTGQGPGLSNVVIGEVRGSETVTLTTANLPAAAPTTVSIAVNTDAGTQTSPAGGNTYLGASGPGPGAATIWSNASGNPVNLSGVTVSGGSGGQNYPVNNLPPELGVTVCIATQGVYPSRP